MRQILPGGTQPWHAFDESKTGHYSQLLLKRCVEDRNPMLRLMEDKYRSRELVKSKEVCNLTELYQWSEDASIDWNSLPDRCVIKANHWSGDALFIMDNGPEPLANIPRKFRLFSRRESGYRVIRNWRDQYGRLWPRWRIQRALKKCLKKNIQPNLNGVLQTFIQEVLWLKNCLLITTIFRTIGKCMCLTEKQDSYNTIQDE